MEDYIMISWPAPNFSDPRFLAMTKCLNRRYLVMTIV